MTSTKTNNDDTSLVPEQIIGTLEETTSAVNHPSHYNQGGIECIEAMRAAFGDEAVRIFCKLNAFKYVWRAGDKGPEREDLEKAEWYLAESKPPPQDLGDVVREALATPKDGFTEMLEAEATEADEDIVMRQFMLVNYWEENKRMHTNVVHHNDGSFPTKDLLGNMIRDAGISDGELFLVRVQGSGTYPRQGERIKRNPQGQYVWAGI